MAPPVGLIFHFFCRNNWGASWTCTPSVLICRWCILYQKKLPFTSVKKKLLLGTLTVAKDLCADAAALAKLDSGFTVDNAVLFYSWLLRKPLCTVANHMAVKHFQMWMVCLNVMEAQCTQFTFHIHPVLDLPVAEILMHWKPVASVVKVNLRLMSSKLAKTNLAHEPNDFSHLRSAFSSRRRAVPSLKPISCHLAPAC